MILSNRKVKSHLEGTPNKIFNAIFQEYQERQVLRTPKIMKFANLIAHVQAWDGLWMKLMALWVAPFQSDKKLGKDLEDIIKGGVGCISCQSENAKRRTSRGCEEQPARETSTTKMWNLVKRQRYRWRDLGVVNRLKCTLLC